MNATLKEKIRHEAKSFAVIFIYVWAILGLFALHVNARFDAIDRRFDDMRDLWRAELRRVEEVIDARLRHLEERR